MPRHDLLESDVENVLPIRIGALVALPVKIWELVDQLQKREVQITLEVANLSHWDEPCSQGFGLLANSKPSLPEAREIDRGVKRDKVVAPVHIKSTHGFAQQAFLDCGSPYDRDVVLDLGLDWCQPMLVEFVHVKSIDGCITEVCRRRSQTHKILYSHTVKHFDN